MRTCSEYRSIARNLLQGKWTMAMLVGLVASILGGTGSAGPEINFEYNDNGAHVNLQYAGQTLYSTGGGVDSDIGFFLLSGAVFITIAAIVLAIIYFILGSVIEVGYAKVNLNLLQHQDPSFDTLFSCFAYWKTTAVSSLLRSIYILLWSLLLVIPGIIASYSYRMTSYILAENPELTASEAIERSKHMMDGHKMDLFILELSFIGWDILCLLTLGIGNLWLRPYKEAAFAVFYRDLSGPQETYWRQSCMNEL